GLVFCRDRYLELTDQLRIVEAPPGGWPVPPLEMEPLLQLREFLKWTEAAGQAAGATPARRSP
ncbi:MAG: hypothetical protein IT204_12815, partial [Fimbriimonadaceae bacterium]|nr:hypothetical protein [Fimbriimonadaceae bacterium]